MTVYFFPAKPSSGEGGQYNRRPTFFRFLSRPTTWTWAFSDGGPTSNFPPVRLLVDGQPVTDWLKPVTNNYVFTFDIPDGKYVMSAEGSGVEVLPKPFVMNASGIQLPDDFAWATPTRFERSGVGQPLVPGEAMVKVFYPGALPTPKILPLKERIAEPFREVLRANQLWARHPQRHTHAGMIRRWMRVRDGSPKGALWIEPSQNYFHDQAVNKGLEPPSVTLRDGPRGVGALGFLSEMIPSPVDAGWYYLDAVGRMGFMWHDGRVITIAGWRIKEGELEASGAHLSQNPLTNEDRDFYNAPWEMVGDWSRASLPHAFHEPWSIVGIGGGPTDGLHEFWVTDTLNGKIRYIDHYTAHGPDTYHKAHFPPPGYVPPEGPSGQATIVDFEVGLNQPWGADRVTIDGVEWLYWSEFGGNSISRRRLDGSTPKELVIQSVLNPTDVELGADPWPPYRLHQSKFANTVLRPLFVIDGPPGIASCVRPQALKFDSQGRLTWVEGYVDVLRRLDHDGIVRTIGNLPRGTAAISMSIDKEGTWGPVDDIFTTAWWQADARFSTDGVKRGGIIDGIVSSQILDGPAEWVREPGYGWPIGIGHGRLVRQGNAGASQIVEYTKRQPTDPSIDYVRVKAFENDWWHVGSNLEITHGPNGQGELGFPHIEEIASWDGETQKDHFRDQGIPESQLDNALYYVWASTVNHDTSGVVIPPEEPIMKSILATITTVNQSFPFGTTAQSYRFEITGPENRFIDVPYAGPLSAQFDDVADGIYTVTAELLDNGGQRLGNLLSQQVTVSTVPADIILQVPSGLTVQVITA